MTQSEKTLKWFNDFVKENGVYPLISEIKAQLEMAVDSERQQSTEVSDNADSKALSIADVSSCLVKSNYLEKSEKQLEKYSKSLNNTVKLAVVESWQDGFEEAIKFVFENNC